jgi:hypothetical protein
MATSVLFQEQVEIPLDIGSLADFRRWAAFGSILSATTAAIGSMTCKSGREAW